MKHWWGEVQVWLQVELKEDDYENDFKNWMLLLQSEVKLDAHIYHGVQPSCTVNIERDKVQ
jgi:hypothetical protein